MAGSVKRFSPTVRFGRSSLQGQPSTLIVVPIEKHECNFLLVRHSRPNLWSCLAPF